MNGCTCVSYGIKGRIREVTLSTTPRHATPTATYLDRQQDSPGNRQHVQVLLQPSLKRRETALLHRWSPRGVVVVADDHGVDHGGIDAWAGSAIRR